MMPRMDVAETLTLLVSMRSTCVQPNRMGHPGISMLPPIAALRPTLRQYQRDAPMAMRYDEKSGSAAALLLCVHAHAAA